MTEDIVECYETLGVAPGASRDAVKEAYRDMAKVWHPDRFTGDERLAQKAQEKLKEINAAYGRLEQYLAGREDDEEGEFAVPAGPRPRPMNEQPPVAMPFPNLGRTLVTLALLVLALGFIGVIVFLMTSAETRRANSQQDMQAAEFEARRNRMETEARLRKQAEDAAQAERVKALIEQAYGPSRRPSPAVTSTTVPDTASNSLSPTQPPAGDAAYQAGLKAANGLGRPQDEAEAARLFLQAADLGHSGAQQQLAFHYGSGRGVTKNPAEAYKWLALAARQGEPTAIRQLQDFESRLTAAQLEDARSRIQEFLRRPAPDDRQ
jgi:hypothetical protein